MNSKQFLPSKRRRRRNGRRGLVSAIGDSAKESRVKYFKGSGVDHDFPNVFDRIVAGEPFAVDMQQCMESRRFYPRF
jgi:hypothetical protein